MAGGEKQTPSVSILCNSRFSLYMGCLWDHPPNRTGRDAARLFPDLREKLVGALVRLDH
jgi:hypothetical protein